MIYTPKHTLEAVHPDASLRSIEPSSSSSLPPKLSLYDFYNSIFDGIIADTEELKHECYRLRYQVYCIERTGYEDPAAFPDGLERDRYDPHSVHALLCHRPTGTFVGTVRLILHPVGAQDGCFPIHKLAKVNSIDLPTLFPNQNSGEVSRFCISNGIRRRVEDTYQGSGYTAEELAADRRRIIPAMSLGLYRLLVLMSAQNNVRQWYAEMEPFLLRQQSKLGIRSNPIGPLIEYHGKRQICHSDVASLLRRCQADRPEVWELITDKGQYS